MFFHSKILQAGIKMAFPVQLSDLFLGSRGDLNCSSFNRAPGGL